MSSRPDSPDSPAKRAGAPPAADGGGWGRLRQGVWAGACRPRSLLSPPRPGRLRVHVRRRPAASDAAELGRHAPQVAGSGLLTPDRG